MKKYILIFNLILIILTSCNNNETKYQDEPDYFNDENLISMLDIYNQLLNRMRSADLISLEKAFIEENQEDLCLLLNYSQQDLDGLSEQLQIAVNNLLSKYPAINNMLDGKECIKCNAKREELFEVLKYSEFKPLSLVASPMIKTRSEDGCQESGGLIACLIACAAAPTSVVTYPACAVFCYYAFC